jgi:hypothetical protein
VTACAVRDQRDAKKVREDPAFCGIDQAYTESANAFGTLAFVAAFGAACGYLATVGLDAVVTRLCLLTLELRCGLATIPHVELFPVINGDMSGVVQFRCCDDISVTVPELETLVLAEGVVVAASPSALQIHVHYYNSLEEVRQAVARIRAVVGRTVDADSGDEWIDLVAISLSPSLSSADSGDSCDDMPLFEMEGSSERASMTSNAAPSQGVNESDPPILSEGEGDSEKSDDEQSAEASHHATVLPLLFIAKHDGAAAQDEAVASPIQFGIVLTSVPSEEVDVDHLCAVGDNDHEVVARSSSEDGGVDAVKDTLLNTTDHAVVLLSSSEDGEVDTHFAESAIHGMVSIPASEYEEVDDNMLYGTVMLDEVDASILNFAETTDYGVRPASPFEDGVLLNTTGQPLGCEATNLDMGSVSSSDNDSDHTQDKPWLSKVGTTASATDERGFAFTIAGGCSGRARTSSAALLQPWPAANRSSTLSTSTTSSDDEDEDLIHPWQRYDGDDDVGSVSASENGCSDLGDAARAVDHVWPDVLRALHTSEPDDVASPIETMWIDLERSTRGDYEGLSDGGTEDASQSHNSLIVAFEPPLFGINPDVVYTLRATNRVSMIASDTEDDTDDESDRSQRTSPAEFASSAAVSHPIAIRHNTLHARHCGGGSLTPQSADSSPGLYAVLRGCESHHEFMPLTPPDDSVLTLEDLRSSTPPPIRSAHWKQLAAYQSFSGLGSHAARNVNTLRDVKNRSYGDPILGPQMCKGL